MIAKHLDCRARQLARSRCSRAHQPRQVLRGAEGPLAGDPNQVDAARGVIQPAVAPSDRDVDAVGQALGQCLPHPAARWRRTAALPAAAIPPAAPAGPLQDPRHPTTRFSARLAMAMVSFLHYSLPADPATWPVGRFRARRLRKYSGANASFWCSSTSPSRTSSSAAAKEDANTVGVLRGVDDDN